MRWYHNLKTRWKLLLGFVLIMALMAYVGYTGISSAIQSNEQLTKLYEHDLLGLSAIKEANTTFGSMGQAIRRPSSRRIQPSSKPLLETSKSWSSSYSLASKNMEK